MTRKEPYSRNAYLEYVTVGTSVKVSAIDADTGVEVSIVAPKTASQGEMNRIALSKLDRVMNKTVLENQTAASSRQRGKLV